MNRSATFAAMMAATASIALAESTAPTADLSPGLTVGQTGTWIITRSFQEDSKAIVAESTTKVSATIECATEVRSLRADGGHIVEVTISRIAGEGASDEWTGSFDSGESEVETAERDDFDRALTGIAGRTFELVLDPFGTIVDARGLDDLQNRDPSAATIAEIVLGIDSMDRTFGPIFAIKPESPFTIPVGESYTDICDAMLSVGRVLTRVELTLASMDGSTAKLDLGGRTQLFGNTETDVSPKITEEEIVGLATWDTAKHALLAYDLSVDWTLEAGGKQMPIKITRAEDISIVKKK